MNLRRMELARFKELEPPADRFETRGPVYHGNTYRRTAEPTSDAASDWKGIGCCPGVIRGAVRVVTDPRNAVIKPGEILVAVPACYAAGVLAAHGVARIVRAASRNEDEVG